MNDITRLMRDIGARIHYRMFHERTVAGHTQVPRRAAPLAQTGPKSDSAEPLYDPEGAPYESHPLAEDAMPPFPPPPADRAP